MKYVSSFLVAMFAALLPVIASANTAPVAATMDIHLYSATRNGVELFVSNFKMSKEKRNEPLEIFNAARAQCKQMGFTTAKRRETIDAVMKIGAQDLPGTLLRYGCISALE
jgi:hypothetical protein